MAFCYPGFYVWGCKLQQEGFEGVLRPGKIALKSTI